MVFRGEVRVADAALGPRAANRLYWRLPFRDPGWESTARRLDDLGAARPTELEDFVRTSLERTRDPITIASLARHPLSRNVAGAWLVEHVEDLSPRLRSRLQANRLLGGAVAVAAQLLLDPGPAQRLVDQIVDLYEIPDSRLFAFMDSFGCTPTAAGDACRSRSFGPIGTRRTIRHRLVIAEHFKDPDAIALLLPDAARTTLIATTETFGQADFSAYRDLPGVGDVVVEHVRSRITRFSQPYIDLHETTATIAGQIAHHVMELTDLSDHSDERFLSVEVADFLFFQSLAIRALEVLLQDDDIDEIVLAVEDANRSASFVRLVSQVTGLLNDARLRVASVSQSAAARASFWRLLERLGNDDPPPSSPTRRVPTQLTTRKFDAECRRLAGLLDAATDVVSGRSVLVVTTNNHRYNESTASYIHELRREFDVRVLHVGPEPDDLSMLLEDESPGILITHLAPSPHRFASAAELILDHLEERLQFPDDVDDPALRAVIAALDVVDRRMATAYIAPALSRMRTLHYWLDTASATGDEPDAIVVTPHRTPGVGALEVLARRFGIPTIVVEPHAQDANYSRYTKVLGDYYGVMSDYFRRTTADAFGIGIDRIATIGSPRQIAPPGYDPLVEQRRARVRYETDGGRRLDHERPCLVFFCQPSDWSHVSKVWANILDAARRNDCRVVLKPHPEESKGRVAQYVALARSCAQGDDVIVFDGDAAEAVALADIVLTGYSTSALDAAIRQTPVICVTDGDVSYPVDFTAIVDAPLARSADELSDLIVSFRNDPAATRARARALIDREHQFVEGPGPRLRRLAADAISRGPDALRDPCDLPSSLFLDGPHPVFPV